MIISHVKYKITPVKSFTYHDLDNIITFYRILEGVTFHFIRDILDQL